MKTKEFDCVEMMHEGQRSARKRLAGLSREEKLAYYRNRAKEIREEQESIRELGSISKPGNPESLNPGRQILGNPQ